MFTLISAALGLVGSFLPHLLDYFRERQESKERIEVAKVRAETAGATLTQKDASDARTIAKEGIESGGFGGFLIKSVTPVVTYAMFIEWLILVNLLAAGKVTTTIFLVIWNDPTSSLFALVFSFWFGREHFGPSKRKRNA